MEVGLASTSAPRSKAASDGGRRRRSGRGRATSGLFLLLFVRRKGEGREVGGVDRSSPDSVVVVGADGVVEAAAAGAAARLLFMMLLLLLSLLAGALKDSGHLCKGAAVESGEGRKK